MSEVEGMGLETGDIGEQAQEVSEEAKQKVSENQKKAKQVKSQIQKQQKQDKKIADMLSVLLRVVDDDNTFLYMFSLIENENLSVSDIFESILPFVVDELNEDFLKEVGLKKENYIIKHTVKDYFDYFKKLMKNSSFENLDKEKLVNYLQKIMYYFDIGEIKTIRDKESSVEEYDEKIKNYLYEGLQ